MILLDTLQQSTEFKIIRTKIKEEWYIKGVIPVYHYQWSPIKQADSKHEILLPFYTMTHVQNKEVIGDFSLLCMNDLYKGSVAGKEKHDRRSFRAEKTIFAQVYYIMRIAQWYQHNPTYCSGALIKYLKHVIADYAEFYNPKMDWNK